MNNIALGKYLSLDSIIHRMDPRAKIGAMLIVMITIFISVGYTGYEVIVAAAIGTTLPARLKLSFLQRAMRPMLSMLAFLFTINLLAIRDEDVLFIIFRLSAYTGAVAQTLYIAIRLALMVMIITILIATTKPLELTLGIEDLLKLFQVTHVPTYEIAMTISIAPRFILMLIEKIQRIMKVQVSRGVNMEEGNLMERVRVILSLVVPLFVSAFQRAEDPAHVMEVRGYVPNRVRTYCKQLKMEDRDYTLLIAPALVFTVMVTMTLYIQI